MWYLQSATKAARRYSLVPGREMVVGRKDCDILLSGDGSVSRRHATLCVSEGNPGVVTVTDCKSKFGTAVNDKRMGASQKLELKRNDIVTFGQGAPSTHSRFRSG
jgi:pSer/pThr/pTyr-binding forkhead associated (FHA) protein